jgi:hypothetical protein
MSEMMERQCRLAEEADRGKKRVVWEKRMTNQCQQWGKETDAETGEAQIRTA